MSTIAVRRFAWLLHCPAWLRSVSGCVNTTPLRGYYHPQNEQCESFNRVSRYWSQTCIPAGAKNKFQQPTLKPHIASTPTRDDVLIFNGELYTGSSDPLDAGHSHWFSVLYGPLMEVSQTWSSEPDLMPFTSQVLNTYFCARLSRSFSRCYRTHVAAIAPSDFMLWFIFPHSTLKKVLLAAAIPRI